MDRSTLIITLALFTLISGLLVAVYQLWATARAKRQGEHADGTKDRPNA